MPKTLYTSNVGSFNSGNRANDTRAVQGRFEEKLTRNATKVNPETSKLQKTVLALWWAAQNSASIQQSVLGAGAETPVARTNTSSGKGAVFLSVLCLSLLSSVAAQGQEQDYCNGVRLQFSEGNRGKNILIESDGTISATQQGIHLDYGYLPKGCKGKEVDVKVSPSSADGYGFQVRVDIKDPAKEKPGCGAYVEYTNNGLSMKNIREEKGDKAQPCDIMFADVTEGKTVLDVIYDRASDIQRQQQKPHGYQGKPRAPESGIKFGGTFRG